MWARTSSIALVPTEDYQTGEGAVETFHLTAITQAQITNWSLELTQKLGQSCGAAPATRVLQNHNELPLETSCMTFSWCVWSRRIHWCGKTPGVKTWWQYSKLKVFFLVLKKKKKCVWFCLVLFFKTGSPSVVYVAKDGLNLLTLPPLPPGLKVFLPNLHGNWNQNPGLVNSRQALDQLSHIPKVSPCHLKGRTAPTT